MPRQSRSNSAPTPTRLHILLVAVIALAATLAVAPAWAESSNYVVNSGFEAGLSGWGTANGLNRTSTQAHSGTYSATLKVPADGTITQVLNDSPNWLRNDAGGQWMKLDVWVKGEPGGVVRLGNGSGFTVPTTLTSSGWTEVTAIFDHSLYGMGGAVDFLAKYSIDDPNATGVVYVDDASETTGDDSVTCPMYVSNCDFEYPYNLQGWNNGSTPGEGLGITTDAHHGSQAALLTQNSSTGTITLNDSPNWLSALDILQAGYSSCTVSAWVKASSTSGGPEKISLQTYGGGTTTAYGSVPASASWQQVSATLPVSYAAGSLDLHVYEVKVPTGGTLAVDNVSYGCS